MNAEERKIRFSKMNAKEKLEYMEALCVEVECFQELIDEIKKEYEAEINNIIRRVAKRRSK